MHYFPNLSNDVHTMYLRSDCLPWVHIVSVGTVLACGDVVVLVAPGQRVLALQTDRLDTLREFDDAIISTTVKCQQNACTLIWLTKLSIPIDQNQEMS